MILVSKDKILARLNELGFAEVQRLRNLGENLGDDEVVREWLEIRAFERLEEAHLLQKRSVAAAERSARASEKAAGLSALAAFISLVAILVTLAKEWGWFN